MEGDCDALGKYIENSKSYPEYVIYHNQDFVAVKDAEPKSSVHSLLLPGDEARLKRRPFVAFEDKRFLAKVRAPVSDLRAFAANELRRRFVNDTEQERARREAMDCIDPNSAEGKAALLPPKSFAACMLARP